MMVILREYGVVIAASIVMLFLSWLEIRPYVERNKRRRFSKSRHKKGHEYEEAVVKYLKRSGFWCVRLVGGNGGDYGVDITARKGLLRKFAIQCKWYSTPVGVRAVQEVVGGKRVYSCNRAMVITNNTFTRQARKLAAENNVILWEGIAR